jgi:hypothetical protein
MEPLALTGSVFRILFYLTPVRPEVHHEVMATGFVLSSWRVQQKEI